MEATVIGKRKKFLNMNFLNDIVEEANLIIHNFENKINDALNDVVDDCFLGKTYTINYEDVLFWNNENIYDKKNKSSVNDASSANNVVSVDAVLKRPVYANNKCTKYSYRQKLEEICADCSSKKINEVVDMLAGKYIYAYSVKERAPRRMWMWADRLACIENEMSNNSFANEDSKYLSKMRDALKTNRYLRRKHNDIYDKLNVCLGYK